MYSLIRILIFSVLYFQFSTKNAKCQVQNAPDSSYRLVGIDVGKTVFANLKGAPKIGYSPELIWRAGTIRKKSFFMGFAFYLGYTFLSKNEPYPNTEYECLGYFMKAGFEWGNSFGFPSDNPVFLTYGLHLVGTRFTNRGRFTIEGNFFPDYRQTYEINQFLVGVQPAFQLFIPVGKQIILSGGGQISGIVSPIKKNNSQQIFWYTPGMGVTQDGRLSGSIFLQLYYKL